MIIGTINNISDKIHEYPPSLCEVLRYLKSTDFSKLKDGDYPIGDNGIVAKLQRYETKLIDECKPESHIKFVDVQFIVSGEEFLGWCPLSPDLEVVQDYDETKDVAFYKNLIPESCVVLISGSFAVLYPSDVHQPCGSLDEDNPSKVVKVVVKIPIELLK